jgi:hypothetical protein
MLTSEFQMSKFYCVQHEQVTLLSSTTIEMVPTYDHHPEPPLVIKIQKSQKKFEDCGVKVGGIGVPRGRMIEWVDPFSMDPDTTRVSDFG